MPQAVEGDLRQTAGGKQRMESLQKKAVLQWEAPVTGEDQVGRSFRRRSARSLPQKERPHHGSRHVDDPVAGGSLRSFQHQSGAGAFADRREDIQDVPLLQGCYGGAAGPRERFVHTEGAFIPVDVIPCQSKQLPFPQRTGKCQLDGQFQLQILAVVQ